MASLVAQTVKNLPAMQETQVQPLGQEDLLEKEMATHSSVLAWRIPWTEEPDGLQSMGSQESDMTEPFSLSLFSSPLFLPLVPAQQCRPEPSFSRPRFPPSSVVQTVWQVEENSQGNYRACAFPSLLP